MGNTIKTWCVRLVASAVVILTGNLPILYDKFLGIWGMIFLLVFYLTEFYSYTIVGNTMHWIQEGMPPYRERYLYLVSKSFEDSIDDMIRSYLHS